MEKLPESGGAGGLAEPNAPQGKPQERVLNVVPFLARYGPSLLGEIRDAIGAWYAGALERAPASA